MYVHITIRILEVLQGYHTTVHLESPMSWSPAVSLEDISQMDKTGSVIDAKQLEVNIGLRQLAKSVQDVGNIDVVAICIV